ncbi:hypothetical protein FHG87_015970 [Trinorchestia longiramus]|nr:hypothetical protein FHG87_015970 [Trinorchestia longiramus]
MDSDMDNLKHKVCLMLGVGPSDSVKFSATRDSVVNGDDLFRSFLEPSPSSWRPVLFFCHDADRKSSRRRRGESDLPDELDSESDDPKTAMVEKYYKSDTCPPGSFQWTVTDDTGLDDAESFMPSSHSAFPAPTSDSSSKSHQLVYVSDTIPFNEGKAGVIATRFPPSMATHFDDGNLSQPLDDATKSAKTSGETVNTDHSSESANKISRDDTALVLHSSAEGTIQRSVGGSLVDGGVEQTEIHLIYVQKNIRDSLQAVFENVYMPVIERVSREDKTGLLLHLSSTLLRLTKARSGQLKSVTHYAKAGQRNQQDTDTSSSSGSDSRYGSEGEEENSESGTGSESENNKEQEKEPADVTVAHTLTMSLEEVLARCNGSTGAGVAEVTLNELKNSWQTAFVQLCSLLSQAHAHLEVENLQLEARRRREDLAKKLRLEAATTSNSTHDDAESARDHLARGNIGKKASSDKRVVDKASISKDHSSNEVTRPSKERPGRGAAKSHEAATAGRQTSELARLVVKLEEAHGSMQDCHRSLNYLEKYFKTLLEAGVSSALGVVTQQLRPKTLLPPSMKEALPFQESEQRVEEAVKVLEEWQAALHHCAFLVNSSGTL